MAIGNYVPSFLRSMSRRNLIIGGIVVAFILIIGIWHFAKPSAPTSSSSGSTPHVTLATVADLSSQAGPLSVVGTVKSESQATILAQTSGEITNLSHQIGDHVAAGEIIGQFENSSQRAAVEQAQGSYEAAQAALAKATGSTAANSGITSSQAATAQANAEAALTTSLNSMYAALDDAVHAKADTLFYNARDANPTIKPFTVPDNQLVINIENQRASLAQVFSDAHAQLSGSDSLDIRAAAMLSDAQVITAFLNDFITALNEAVPSNSESSSDISAAQTTLAAARSEVTTAAASLTTAKGTYDSAVSGAQTAANSATTGTQSDIAAAQASVKSAQGALDVAKANLEKTIIRSPISGTIVSLPVTDGDYVSSFAQVAIVSNPSALYVDTQVTSDDAKTLALENAATIMENVPGVITFIAPALDPSTGKIEVKIGITKDTNTLTDGEIVSVSLNRTHAVSATTDSTITLPIVALKITPAGPSVFTLTASSTLQAHAVTLGSILGDRIVVLSGLTPDMQIITDARGLSEGQRVITDASGVATSTAAL